MRSIQYRMAAPVGRVWDAWTKIAQLTAWDPDRVEGKIDAGQRVVMHWDSLGVSLGVDVITCEVERELRLRVQRPDGTLQDLLVEMQGAGEGATDLALSFEGAMSDDEKRGTASGWHTQLRLLGRYLSLPPEARVSFSALGPAIITIERAYEAFVKPSSWLCQEEIEFYKEGQPYSMAMIDTREIDPMGIEPLRLSGEVLSLVQGRELALWCDELNGVVRMRAIPLAGERARLLGAQVVRWGERPETMAIQEALREGVDRLVGLVGGPRGSA